MAGAGRLDGFGDHLRRAQILDHQHIRALTQRPAKRGEQLVGAAAHLSLADQPIPAVVQHLDPGSTVIT